MKKTTGILMIILALFFAFIWTDTVKAAVIPGLTGVQDGGAYSGEKVLNITEEGKYTLKFVDTTNNSQEINFWIDRTAPQIMGAQNNLVYYSDLQVSLNDGVNGSGIGLVTLDNQDITGTLVNNGFTIITEGTHNLIVTDKAGNVSSVSNFKIQKQTKPVITGLLIGMTLFNDDEAELWGERRTIAATGTINGIPFEANKYEVVITDGAGNQVPNDFWWGEDYNSFDREIGPDAGFYRVYIKDKNGNRSDNYLIAEWLGWGIRAVQDTVRPTVSISEPSKYSAVGGEDVTYTVTYEDNYWFTGITLKPSDVKVYNNGVEIERTVMVSGTDNTRTITVPVGSETGTLGIKIDENTAYDVGDNLALGATSTEFRVNSTPFVFENVKIYSNNQINDSQAKHYANTGNKVTLEFDTSEDIQNPTVKIFGKTAVVTGSGKHWQAVYTVVSGDKEGVIPFSITCYAGNNVYLTQTESTDGSNVIFDKTPPTSNINDGTTYNSVTLNINFSDNLSGIYSSTMSINNGPAEPIQSDMNYSAEANYLLTLTDIAGNITTVRFIISREKPTITGYSFRETYHWYDSESHENLYSYVIDATGTDGVGNTINASYSNVIVMTVSGQNISNYFILAEDDEDQFLYRDPEGEFRIYIKDNAGSISDNYITVRL